MGDGDGSDGSDGAAGAAAAAAAGLGTGDGGAPSDSGVGGGNANDGAAAAAAAGLGTGDTGAPSDAGIGPGPGSIGSFSDPGAIGNFGSFTDSSPTGFGQDANAAAAAAAQSGLASGLTGQEGAIGSFSALGQQADAQAALSSLGYSNEGFGFSGVSLGFSNAPSLGYSQAEQDAIDAVMGVAPPGLSFSTPAAPFGTIAAPPTDMDAELGLDNISVPPAPTTAEIDDAMTGLGLFGIAPTVNAPSPFGQQASFAVAPDIGVEEGRQGLLGMTLSEQQDAIDARDAENAKEAKEAPPPTQEEAPLSLFEQQAIMEATIALNQTLQQVDQALAQPQQAPPPTVPSTLTQQDMAITAPPVAPQVQGPVTNLGIDPDNPAPPVSPVDPDNPAYSQPPPAPPPAPPPEAPQVQGPVTNLGIDPDNPTALPAITVDPDNPVVTNLPTEFSRPPPIPEETLPFPEPLSPQIAVPMPQARPGNLGQPEAPISNLPPNAPQIGVNPTLPSQFSFPNTTTVTTVPITPTETPQQAPPPAVVAPPQQQQSFAPVTQQQHDLSQQIAIDQLGQPAKGPSLAESLGFLGTGITGFTPGSNLASFAATQGPVAAAAAATGFPVTAAIAMQSLYNTPLRA